MNSQALEGQLLAICRLEGLIGCAVVDIATGMAWKSAGAPEVQALCECASDFWRLHGRHAAHYASLGELGAQVLIHARGRLTLVACPDSLLLVCISEEPDRVDWARWKLLVKQLNHMAATP